MQKVVLNLRRMEPVKPVDKRKLPRGSGIAARDRNVLARRKHNVVKRLRGIDPTAVDRMLEELPIYLEGHREHVFNARVVPHNKMHTLLNLQEKIFNQWLTSGKVPYACFCVRTGTRGYPPKAYLEEECRSLIVALNTHYKEHSTVRNTDTGLRRNIHAALLACRERKAKSNANPCI